MKHYCVLPLIILLSIVLQAATSNVLHYEYVFVDGGFDFMRGADHPDPCDRAPKSLWTIIQQGHDLAAMRGDSVQQLDVARRQSGGAPVVSPRHRQLPATCRDIDAAALPHSTGNLKFLRQNFLKPFRRLAPGGHAIEA